MAKYIVNYKVIPEMLNAKGRFQYIGDESVAIPKGTIVEGNIVSVKTSYQAPTNMKTGKPDPRFSPMVAALQIGPNKYIKDIKYAVKEYAVAKEETPTSGEGTGAKASETTTPAPATEPKKLDWKKILTGVAILALIAVVLAYILKKRSAKELIAFGVAGGAIGGISMFLLKDKKIPGVSGIASKITGGRIGSLEDKMFELTKRTMSQMATAFGGSQADVDKMMKEFDTKAPELKKMLTDAIAKLTAEEKSAAGEMIDFTLSKMDEYKGKEKDQAAMDKMGKEIEEYMVKLKKKYPAVDFDRLMDKAAGKEAKKGESKWHSSIIFN
jgi:hypothetical protein